MMGSMWRTVLLHGALLAAGALGLQWLQYRFLVHAYPGEAALGVVGLVFLGLGLWAGGRLFTRASPQGPVPLPAPDAPIPAPVLPPPLTLGISEREREVLQLLADGRSNKEIARCLGVSPNTVKTHIARLFEKLQARRRTEAIARARTLGVLP